MPGNRLTLSTDDGEQAGEENDRMAPHHLFHLPSRLEAISTRPSSSSSSLFSYLAARVDRSAFPLTRNEREKTHCYYVPLVLPPPLPPRDIRSCLACRSLDGISLVSSATRSPFNAATKDPAFSTHITCVLPRPLSRSARERSSPTVNFLRRKVLLRTNHESPVHSMSALADPRNPLSTTTTRPFSRSSWK